MDDNRQEQLQGIKKHTANIVFFVLFVIRIIDLSFLGPTPGIRNSTRFSEWYFGGLYILTILLVWLNRKNLAKLNMDKYSIYLLLFGGSIWVLYLPGDLGVLAVLCVAFIFWALRSNQFNFSTDAFRYPPEIWIFGLISVGVGIAPIFYYKLENVIVVDAKSFLIASVDAQLALVVFEEILFRGALWSFLNTLGLKNRNILLLQALLFWISHHRYLGLNNPYVFWFSIPLNAVLFGLMTWRSKSLTPSILNHFLYNLVSAVIINALS